MPHLLTGAIIGFLLSIDRAPLAGNIQVAPPISLLAMMMLPFCKIRSELSPIAKTIIIFTAYVILQSTLVLYVDYVILFQNDTRLTTFMRQFISFTSGISVYYVLSGMFTNISVKKLIAGLMYGTIPAITLGALSLVTFLSGSTLTETIVTGVRAFILKSSTFSQGLAYQAVTQRAAGLSNEPSAFAQFLMMVAMPVALIYRKHVNSQLGNFVLVGIAASLLGTFSGSGFALSSIFTFAGAFIIQNPNQKLLKAAFLLNVMLIAVTFALIPGNYISYMTNYLLENSVKIQGEAKTFSSIGPFVRMFESYSLVGYGLGGSSIYLQDIVPEMLYETFATNSGETLPNIKSFFGRIFSETGIIGLGLFILIIVIAFKQINKSTRLESEQLIILSCGKLALVACIVGAYFGGAYSSPYLWFWLAIIESRINTNSNDTTNATA